MRSAGDTVMPATSEQAQRARQKRNPEPRERAATEASSNRWRRATVALRVSLSGLILLVSAACTNTPAPTNTSSTEVTARAGSEAGRTHGRCVPAFHSAHGNGYRCRWGGRCPDSGRQRHVHSRARGHRCCRADGLACACGGRRADRHQGGRRSACGRRRSLHRCRLTHNG